MTHTCRRAGGPGPGRASLGAMPPAFAVTCPGSSGRGLSEPLKRALPGGDAGSQQLPGPGHPKELGDPGPGRCDPQRRPSAQQGAAREKPRGPRKPAVIIRVAPGSVRPRRTVVLGLGWTLKSRGKRYRPSAGAVATCPAVTPTPLERPQQSDSHVFMTRSFRLSSLSASFFLSCSV